MATRYDHPNVIVTREEFAGSVGAASATDYAPFRMFQKAKLVAAHFVCTVTTSNVARRFRVFVSAVSVGSVSIGTLAVGATVSIDLGDTALASLSRVTTQFDVAADGSGDVIYEYRVEPDAVQSS